MSSERLHKIIAASGLASRREAEHWIRMGRVVVNGTTIRKQGTKADPMIDDIRVDNKRVIPVVHKLYLMMNKPRSVMVTFHDPQGRKTIGELLKGKTTNRGKNRVFHVGRLDYASEGLLILTNDGSLAMNLSHPRNQVPKTYQVKTQGFVIPVVLQQLRNGLLLKDGPARAISVRHLKNTQTSSWVEIVVTEGRNRLVRRMLNALGIRVLRLKRVAFGGVLLGQLRSGEVRKLTTKEVTRLRKWTMRKKCPLKTG